MSLNETSATLAWFFASRRARPGGPAEPLVDPQKEVGGCDPPPGRTPHQDKGDVKADDPPPHEEPLPSDPVGEPSRGKVRKSFEEHKTPDEREDDALGDQPG